jgi:hypothetical protein
VISAEVTVTKAAVGFSFTVATVVTVVSSKAVTSDGTVAVVIVDAAEGDVIGFMVMTSILRNKVPVDIGTCFRVDTTAVVATDMGDGAVSESCFTVDILDRDLNAVNSICVSVRVFAAAAEEAD